jgi:septal ring factor EnvC (AmiA/AmiB activator)
LSAYEQKTSQLVKETSLLGKKLDALQNETAASIDKRLDKNLSLLRQDFEKNLSLLRQDLEKQIADVKRRADAAEKAAATAAAAKSTPKQLPPKSTNQVQSTVKPQASSPNALPTPTRKTETPDLPRQTIPGTGNISEQDISQ